MSGATLTCPEFGCYQRFTSRTGFFKHIKLKHPKRIPAKREGHSEEVVLKDGALTLPVKCMVLSKPPAVDSPQQPAKCLSSLNDEVHERIKEKEESPLPPAVR